MKLFDFEVRSALKSGDWLAVGKTVADHFGISLPPNLEVDVYSEFPFGPSVSLIVSGKHYAWCRDGWGRHKDRFRILETEISRQRLEIYIREAI